jgi:hypothetical protein
MMSPIECASSPSPIHAFTLKKTPEAFWVAEKDHAIIEFSNSFLRGTLWYLSFLFILPGYQGQSIGKNLLEKTLGSWKNTEITNRAAITFAYNPASQYLYMQYGMFPREPVYYMSTTRELVKDTRKTDELEYEEVRNLRNGSDVLERIDEDVLGFSLGWHHEYFFETQAKCYLFNRNGEAQGYAYVQPNGTVGPVAVKSNGDCEAILSTALGLAASQEEVQRVSFWNPGSNVHAIQLALKYRMRIESPMMFMSTNPFGKWENYLYQPLSCRTDSNHSQSSSDFSACGGTNSAVGRI